MFRWNRNTLGFCALCPQNISDAWKTQVLEAVLQSPALLCGAALSSCTA